MDGSGRRRPGGGAPVSGAPGPRRWLTRVGIYSALGLGFRCDLHLSIRAAQGTHLANLWVVAGDDGGW
jgi:hypothetical protein